MKRRFIFGLVLVALLLNLAVGAKIYFNAAPRRPTRDNPQANLDFQRRHSRKSAANMWTARI